MASAFTAAVEVVRPLAERFVAAFEGRDAVEVQRLVLEIKNQLEALDAGLADTCVEINQ